MTSASAAARRPSVVGWAPWAVIALVLGASLWIGSGTHRTLTLDQRVRQVAADVRCPSCTDLTAADSNAATAVAVRDVIRQRLQQGQTPAQIESWLAGRYGQDILLRPPARGLAGLVWALPVAAVAAALAGLGFAFARWRRRVPGLPPADEDRARVARALDEAGVHGAGESA